MLVELLAQMPPAVQVQHRAVCGRRAVERDLRARRGVGGPDLVFVGTGDDERQPADLEPVEVVLAGRGPSFSQRRQRHLPQIALGGEPVQEEPVGHLTGHPRHLRPHSGEDHRRVAERVGPGVEERGHQGVAVVLADEMQFLADGPAVPNRPHRKDELAHALGRGGPRH